jgi:hypothetical protein
MTTGLKLLVKFLEKLEITPLSWDTFTRDAALTELEEKHGLINKVLSSIDPIKKIFQESSNEALYLAEVKVRMEFIQFCRT